MRLATTIGGAEEALAQTPSALAIILFPKYSAKQHSIKKRLSLP
jgi:hypothetical protein